MPYIRDRTPLEQLKREKQMPFWRGIERVRGDSLDDYVDLGK